MNATYDVIIIGARVAGSSSAILLGEIGKKVLLVDKAAFPSDTLSTHYMSHTGYLRELGVLQQLERSGLRKVRRMRTYIGDSFIEGPRASYTIIPKRDELDHVLIKKALESPNITFKSQTSARDLIWEGGKVVGVRLEEFNDTYDVHSEIVIGADGKNSNIAHWVGADKYHQTPPLRPVLYGYYEGVDPLLEPTTEIFLNEGRIGFVFPMEEGRDCLGLEIQPGEFKTMMKMPQESFEKMFRQLYGMEGRMEKARLQGKIMGTPGMPNFFRKAYGEGWVLIGDAGHSKDPSTGLGINDAFSQSFLLAKAVKQLDKGQNWSEVMTAFEKRRDEQLLPGFQLTLDYIQSLRKWAPNEIALFQSMAANPMVWNKIVPHLGEYLRKQTTDFPLLHTSIKLEAQEFGYWEE